MTISLHAAGPLASRLREYQGHSLRSVAQRLDVTHPALRKAEAGDSAMRTLALREVALLLEEITGEPPAIHADELVLTTSQETLLKDLRSEEMVWRRVFAFGVFREVGLAFAVGDERQAVILNEAGITINLWTAMWGKTGTALDVPITPGLHPWHRADRASWKGLLQLAKLFENGPLDPPVLEMLVAMSPRSELDLL